MLEIRNVYYAYKSQKGKTILNGVSAVFEEGIFYSIIGASGAGKTTLLSLLAGLDIPSEEPFSAMEKTFRKTV